MKLAFYLLLFSLRVFATEELIYSGSLYAKNGDTLEILVEREFGKTFITSREPWSKWVKRIKKLNPKLNLRYLSRNEEVVIQIPKEKISNRKVLNSGEFFDPKKNNEDFIRFATSEDEDTAFFATDLNDNSKYNYLFKPNMVEPVEDPAAIYRLSAFYMGSLGTFKETTLVTNIRTIEGEQNSPLSFGLSFGRNYDHYVLSGSVYFSFLNSDTSDFGTPSENIDLPMEWGANLYYNNKRNLLLAPIFYGVDIESFSAFNTDEFVLGSSLTTRKHNLVYATIGYDYVTDFYNGRVLLRGSVARSVFSTASRQSAVSQENFKGWRFTAYANYMPQGKLYYHFLYKQHNLEGPTKLKIQRIGLGFGVSFF